MRRIFRQKKIKYNHKEYEKNMYISCFKLHISKREEMQYKPNSICGPDLETCDSVKALSSKFKIMMTVLFDFCSDGKCRLLILSLKL